MTDSLQLIDEWGPEKIVCVSDVRTGMRGVLVIDNTARGMGKGGTRMSSSVTVTEIARLARVMTWKWAGVDLFFGGAKAGIAADPTASSKEAVLRSFVRALHNEVPREYVVGLDMGLNEEDAAIVQDEVGDRGAAVGTPAALGGIPYDEIGVTGIGIAESADAAASAIGMSVSDSRIAIQGFGAVGTAVAERLAEFGGTIVAISTSRGVVHDQNGLDIARLIELRKQVGDDCVLEYGSGELIGMGEEFLVPSDIAIPAALQDTINVEVARRMPAKLIVEGANLPTSSEAQAYFVEAGIHVVPDFIANAGGVVAAAFAMDARYSPFRPDVDVIRQFVATKLRSNTEAVLERARSQGVSSHVAARDLSQERVAEAMRLKGRIKR